MSLSFYIPTPVPPVPDEMSFYFNAYDAGTAWASNPANMVDGSTASAAVSQGFQEPNTIQLCNGNNSSDQGGSITKVEIRAYAGRGGTPTSFDLIPVFGGASDGDNHDLKSSTSNSVGWSDYFDITNDTNAPGSWSWADVAALDCVIDFQRNAGDGPGDNVGCGQIDIRVTYT